MGEERVNVMEMKYLLPHRNPGVYRERRECVYTQEHNMSSESPKKALESARPLISASQVVPRLSPAAVRK